MRIILFGNRHRSCERIEVEEKKKFFSLSVSDSRPPAHTHTHTHAHAHAHAPIQSSSSLDSGEHSVTCSQKKFACYDIQHAFDNTDRQTQGQTLELEIRQKERQRRNAKREKENLETGEAGKRLENEVEGRLLESQTP